MTIRTLKRGLLVGMLAVLAVLPGTTQATPDVCTGEQRHVCLAWVIAGVGVVVEWVAAQPMVTTPPGAGEVMLPPGSDTQPHVCSVTPSTGQMSGMNVRAEPDIESRVIGGIALGDFREVTAIGEDWHETVTRNGEPGYVAAHVAALVGACGDVPRLDE